MPTPFDALGACWTHDRPGQARCGDVVAAVPFVSMATWEVVDASEGDDDDDEPIKYWLPVSYQFGLVVRVVGELGVLIPCLIDEQFSTTQAFATYLGLARSGRMDGWLALPPHGEWAPQGSIALLLAPQTVPAAVLHDMTETEGQRVAGMTDRAQELLRTAISDALTRTRFPLGQAGPGHATS